MAIRAGYMLPHPPIAVAEIGKGEERAIQATLDGYDAVARDIAAIKPETIILSSPHAPMYRDYFQIASGESDDGSFALFQAPQVKIHVDYDTVLRGAIINLADEAGFPAGTLGAKPLTPDHGTLVPLYFINKRYQHYKLVRIGLSGLSLEDHWRFGQIIASAVEKTGKRCVYVASGDLSHCQKADGPYGLHPEGPEYDAKLMDVMGRGDFKALLDFDPGFLSMAEECGHRSFTIMGGALSGHKIAAKTLSHQATFGVGYGTGIFKVTDADDAVQDENQHKEDAYITLARQTINRYVKTREMMAVPDDLPEDMTSQHAGVFVSIHEGGELRGCIGTFLPCYDNVADEIIHNAVAAATRDPRFMPIQADELDALDISVDVLSKPEPATSTDELDAKRYGVIVTNGERRGLLLPNLDGVDTPAEQIAIAKQKAGIRPNEPVELMRFEVVRHEAQA